MKARPATLLAAILTVSFISTSESQTLTANPYGVDPEHYQCYTITATTVTPRSVILRDQFGVRTAQVGNPRRLCVPVSKNNGLLADRVTHLLCYGVTLGPVINKRVEITNQFGKVQFTVQRANELCLPSLKRVLP
jgi:hypothetical protein